MAANQVVPPPGFTLDGGATPPGVVTPPGFKLDASAPTQAPPPAPTKSLTLFGRKLPNVDTSRYNANMQKEGEGLSTIGTGLSRITKGEVAGGSADVIEGGMHAGRGVLYALAPLAPWATAAGLASGALASKVTEFSGKQLGLTPDQARLAGDVVGIFAGTKVGGKVNALRGTDSASSGTGQSLPPLPTTVKFAVRHMFPRMVGDAMIHAYEAAAGEAPIAPEPFRPNPNISKQLQYTPPPPPPGYSPPAPAATGWKPPSESLVPGPEDVGAQPPAPFKFKPNPKVAKLIKGKGSSDTESGMPTAIRSRGPVARPSLTPPPVPPPPGYAPTGVSTMPPAPEATHTDLTRQIHATGREMELPGSPKGQPIHVSPTAQELYGKGWTDLSIGQKQAITEFLHTQKRLPTAADVKAGLFKK